MQQIHPQGISTQPLISFIVTTYNVPINMLSECLASIIGLPMEPSEREIILIDDGSDESPLPSLSKYKDSLTYIRQQNAGVSVARNRALDMASGQYVQFVDGDDGLLPAYRYCINLVRQHAGDIILHDTATETTKDEEEPVADSPIDGGEYMRTNNLHGSACGYLFLKKSLGNLRFSPGITYGEDEEFTPQLLLRCERVVSSNAKAYFYRQHTASVTHKQNVESLRKRLDDTHGVIVRLSKMTDSVPQNDGDGLRRRVAQLTMDYLYNIIVMTHSHEELERRVSELATEGLFPLPDKAYTRKYRIFRTVINKRMGRTLLCKML